MTSRTDHLARIFSAHQDDALITMLARMALHDVDTHVHLLGVADLARVVAVELNIAAQDVDDIETAALMHDIGKLEISRDILRAPRTLETHEWTEIFKHPASGGWMLRQAGYGAIATIVESHHEQLDGSGYPSALKGSNIPLGSQIINVVDAYDTMIYERPYKAARPHADVIEELDGLAGTRYDREIVAALIRVTRGGRVDRRINALRA